MLSDWWQIIIWITDVAVQWRIYAARVVDEWSNKESDYHQTLNIRRNVVGNNIFDH